MLQLVKQFIIESINHYFKVMVKEEDFICERSSNEAKVSWHLFLPTLVMKNYKEMKRFVQEIIDNIMKQKVEDKYLPLIIKKKKKEGSEIGDCFIDGGIYKKHGLFRMVENSKLGKERYLLPFNILNMKEEPQLNTIEKLKEYIESTYFHNVSSHITPI